MPHILRDQGLTVIVVAIISHLQVIAIESANWSTGKDQSRPILPQPKPLGPGPILPQSKQNKWLDDVISTIMLALQKLLGSGDGDVEVVLEGESGDVDEMDRNNEDDLEADSVQLEGSDEIDEEEDDLQADSEEEENEGNAEEEEGEEGNEEEVGDDESIDNDDEEVSVESEDGDEGLEVEVEVDEDFRED